MRYATFTVVLVILPLIACDMFTGNSPQTFSPQLPSTPTETSAPSVSLPPDISNSPSPGNVDNGNIATSPTPAVTNCNTALFQVCDGFETVPPGGAPDANRWTLNVGPPPDDAVSPSAHPTDNFIKVTTARAHRGKQALQIHGAVGAEHIVMQDVADLMQPSTFLPAPNDTFFVRFWFYSDNFSQPPTGGHMYVVNASGPLNGKQQYQKFGGNESGGVMNYSWIYFGPDAAIIADTSWPTQVWTCYETEFKGDTSELHVWINDVEDTKLTSAPGNWVAPDFNRLTLGWEIDHPPTDWPGVDIYLDDVAYSYQRIGCDG